MTSCIHRALSLARVSARLEPVGLLRSDGKRPDGASIIPWNMGKPLVWDATCVDTYAPSYRSLAVTSAGAVAARAEVLKEEKYSALRHSGSSLTIFYQGLGKPDAITLWRPTRTVFLNTCYREFLWLFSGETPFLFWTVSHTDFSFYLLLLLLLFFHTL